MKNQIYRILSALLLISMLFLTGCGGFFEEEVLQIASIESKLMADGQTMVTITYTDDTVEPYVFYIPKGATGDEGLDGNGILEIDPVHNAEKGVTEVRITYTDESMDPVDFEIPDGVSVIGTSEPEIDPVNGLTYITFLFSNGSASAPVYLPKGEQGEAGNGIKEFTVTPNEDGSIDVHIKLDRVLEGTEEDELNFTIPAGNGIADMTATEEGNFYIINVTYTNGETDELIFTRPADPNQWYTGLSAPAPNFGNNGDYFFDTAHKVIYVRESNAWHKVISFKSEELTYTVAFDLNDEGDAIMPDGAKMFYTVARGAYFSADGNGDIPIPTREGYTFGGWYIKKIDKPSATMSPFTDMTAVFSDLTLYAYWIPNN